MTDDYVWTPPGATPEELDRFFTLRSGLPHHLFEEVIGWIRALKADSSGWVYWTFLVQFQTVSKEYLGVADGLYSPFERMADFLRKLEEREMIYILHFLLGEIRSRTYRRGGEADDLESILSRGGSSWAVAPVQDRCGLVERVPVGVAETVEAVISSSGKSSALLQNAWKLAYGPEKSPSHAYFDAVRAVEVLSCPLFSPKDQEPTLGKDINVLRNKPSGFAFIMTGSKHSTAPEHLLSMMQLLWHSQTDRHGSDDYKDVSIEEAQAAVLLASTLIGWLSKGMITRSAES